MAVYGVTLMEFGAATLLVVDSSAAQAGKAAVLSPVRFCGRLSYELYLFHLVILGGIRTLWPPGMTAGDGKLSLLAVYLALSAIVAGLIGRFYAGPLNRLLRQA
jgi:peptidoglycan/LPS O-acetylase OafA/YrhL